MAVDWAGLDINIDPPTTMLDMFKAYLGITDGSKDAELSIMLNQAGPIVERWLDRTVAKREIEQTFRAKFDTITLHSLPVEDLIEVTVDGEVDTGYSWYEGESGIAFVSKSGWPMDTPFNWRRFENVVVKYIAGWDPLPVDLAYGIMWTAASLYRSTGSGMLPGGGGGGTGEIKSMTLYDVGSISYDVGSAGGGTVGAGSGFTWGVGPIPEMAASILSGYKRMSA